jgi:leucyl aminopeptidase
MVGILYKLNLEKKNLHLFEIVFENNDTNKLSFSKETIYTDVRKAKDIIHAYATLWDKKVSKVGIHIPDNLLNEPFHLEHIISALCRFLLKDIYKTSCSIIITHNGTQKQELVEDIVSIINKIQIARKLSMIPPDKGTPLYMAKEISKLFKQKKDVNIKILNEKYLRTKGYNLIYSVGKSASVPCCMLVIERLVKNINAKTVCIVGKGITFDSGGLSLKTIRGMQTMKYDKVGAVNGALALLHLIETIPDLNLVGIFPFAENALSGTASHPTDVVKSFIGKTVEIIDPDAEGRLILADALGHSHRYKPDLVIDIASLTGHAKNINCWHNGYCNVHPPALKQTFEEVSNAIGERMLTMPSWNDCSYVLKSNVADLSNVSIECGDSFTASLFLKEFLPPNCDWIHIDIAHDLDNKIPKATGIHTINAIVKKMIYVNKIKQPQK